MFCCEQSTVKLLAWPPGGHTVTMLCASGDFEACTLSLLLIQAIAWLRKCVTLLTYQSNAYISAAAPCLSRPAKLALASFCWDCVFDAFVTVSLCRINIFQPRLLLF